MCYYTYFRVWTCIHAHCTLHVSTDILSCMNLHTCTLHIARIYRHTYTCRICMCRYIMDIVCVHTHLMYIVCVHIHISVVISRSFFFFEKKALLVTTDIMYIVCVYIYISCMSSVPVSPGPGMDTYPKDLWPRPHPGVGFKSPQVFPYNRLSAALLAQLVARGSDKAKVVGSSPAESRTFFWSFRFFLWYENFGVWSWLEVGSTQDWFSWKVNDFVLFWLWIQPHLC